MVQHTYDGWRNTQDRKIDTAGEDIGFFYTVYDDEGEIVDSGFAALSYPLDSIDAPIDPLTGRYQLSGGYSVAITGYSGFVSGVWKQYLHFAGLDELVLYMRDNNLDRDVEDAGDWVLGYGHDRMGSIRFLFELDHDLDTRQEYGAFGGSLPSDDSTMSVGSLTNVTRRCRVVQYIEYSGFGMPIFMDIVDTLNGGDGWEDTPTSLRDNADTHGKRTDTTTGNPYAHHARRWIPTTGLYYNRFRDYSPTLGRFLSRDPLGYVDGPNLYAFVRNSPSISADIYGLFVPSGPPPHCCRWGQHGCSIWNPCLLCH